MAHFYGQVKGNGRTNATRSGTRASGLSASAQSYNGSVTISIMDNPKDDSDPIFDIEVSDGSRMGGRSVFSGTRGELVMALSNHGDAD